MTASPPAPSPPFPVRTLALSSSITPEPPTPTRPSPPSCAFGCALVVCGRDHLPAGLLLPLSSHTEVVWRIKDQIDASEPCKKRLWQQLIVAKIKRQAANLPQDSPVRGLMEQLAAEVKSGDTTNIEGQAARLYWSAWLSPTGIPDGAVSSATAGAGSVTPPLPAEGEGRGEGPVQMKKWSRDADGLDPLNAMLNYGYAVLRTALGRASVSAGLFPALGIHHVNRSNAFALADDLIEPLRPLVDARVLELHRAGKAPAGLDQPNKAALLELLTTIVRFDDTTGPLMVSLHRYTASFLRCLQGEDEKLMIPTWGSEPWS